MSNNNNCCAGTADAISEYTKESGSIYQCSLIRLYDIPSNLPPGFGDYPVLGALFPAFNEHFNYFMITTISSIYYVYNNCDTCCNSVALSIADLSLGFLNKTLHLFVPPSSALTSVVAFVEWREHVEPVLDRIIDKYRMTTQSLVRNLCDDILFTVPNFGGNVPLNTLIDKAFKK